MANRTENNASKKRVIINGVEYSSLSIASENLNISRFKLLQRVYSPFDSEFLFVNHEQVIEDFKQYLAGKSKLLTEDALVSMKSSGVGMKQIARQSGVSLDTIRLAFDVYGLSKRKKQINDEAFEILESPEKLREHLEGSNAAILAKQIGVSPSAIHHRARSHGIKLENKTSVGETEMFEWIDEFLIDHSVLRHQKVNGFEVDVLIPELNLGVEYHGLFWHKEKPSLHAQKLWGVRKGGVRLIQVWEDDWQLKNSLVKRKLAHVFGFSSLSCVGARQCTLKTLTNADVRQFHEQNHIQGHKNCQTIRGLVFDDVLVAVMGFNRNVLERFSTSCRVVGGFSKLFKPFTDEHDKIKTFADLMWTDPDVNVYRKNGFRQVGVTRPNYFYWSDKTKVRENRMKYQKHKLNGMPGFSAEKTEEQIMLENGFYRIYDAGHLKLEWIKPSGISG